MLSPRFAEALAYAATLHAAQQRKVTGTPYVAHLLAVTALVLEHGADEIEAMAAVLHDAVEDQGGPATRAEIERRFGAPVAALLDWVGDTDQVPKPPWRQRKEVHLARARQAPLAAQRILAADKLHNVRSLVAQLEQVGPAVWQEFRGGPQGTLWYFRAMHAALTLAPPKLRDELAQAIDELERAVSDTSR